MLYRSFIFIIVIQIHYSLVKWLFVVNNFPIINSAASFKWLGNDYHHEILLVLISTTGKYKSKITFLKYLFSKTQYWWLKKQNFPLIKKGKNKGLLKLFHSLGNPEK